LLATLTVVGKLTLETCTSYSTSSASVSVPVKVKAGVTLTPVALSAGVPKAVVGETLAVKIR